MASQPRPAICRSVLACPTRASRAGLQAAIAVLHGDGPSLEGDEALAVMEQHRLDTQAGSCRQPPLPLGIVTE